MYYHLKRLNASRKALGFHTPLTLELHPPKHGLYRCRLIYEEGLEKIEYLPYIMKLPTSFKLIHSNISYDLKYEDRTSLNNLLKEKNKADEIIIIKQGLISDTSIANLCFYDGNKWLTPKTPLLKGTTRQRLLDENKIHLCDISYKDIHKFSKIAVINAMIGFQIIENAIIL
ncbi:MAG TPA: hypothetical protein EYO73_06595 [Sulfurimonas sp.]|nr:hypothetical protein [Sulfurimonas sp.]